MRKLARDSSADPKNIKLVIFDVDGVMTDNRMIFLKNHQEAKAFSAADGFAIKATSGRQLIYAVITARASEVTERRCSELGITEIYQRWNKLEALDELLAKHHLRPEQAAMLGNDVPDIMVMERVGLAVCPSDAEPEVVPFAHYQTTRGGGRGCCRELINFILAAKGVDLLQVYRDGLENH